MKPKDLFEIDVDRELAISEFTRRLDRMEHGTLTISVEKHAGLVIGHHFDPSPYTQDDIRNVMQERPTRRDR